MFKVGDIVRFIAPLENYTATQPIKGCVYTIKYFSSIFAPHDGICLVELPNLGAWKVSRFELVSMGTGSPVDGGLPKLPAGAGVNHPYAVYVPQPCPPSYTQSSPTQQLEFDTHGAIQQRDGYQNCPTIKPKCTCGSSSVGSNKHSDYCDIKN